MRIQDIYFSAWRSNYYTTHTHTHTQQNHKAMVCKGSERLKISIFKMPITGFFSC